MNVRLPQRIAWVMGFMGALLLHRRADDDSIYYYASALAIWGFVSWKHWKGLIW